jgi:hypothetical protein
MLWSCSRSENVPGDVVKKAYKNITNDFREEGVVQAIATCSLELIGKALVSMLTKFDRPRCRAFAYDLAEAILLLSKVPYTGPAPSPEKPLSRQDEMTYFRHALQAGGQNPKNLKTKHGESLAAHAMRKKNMLAFAILRGVVFDEPTFPLPRH